MKSRDVAYVQIDALVSRIMGVTSLKHISLFKVALKIIKHCQEQGGQTNDVQGVLLGLVIENRLEVTNCFPFPKHTEEENDMDESIETNLKLLCPC